jgi:hypothetical protein
MSRFLRRLLRRNKTTAAVVVKRRLSPRLTLLIAIGGAALLLAGANFLYEHGINMAGFERALAVRKQQRLEEQGQVLADENQQLRAALARSERTIQMDQASYQELDKALQASAQEINKLREELNFYRNIISPADKKAGLRVQSLDVEHIGTGGTYKYKLVLIQALKHERTIFGAVNFEISGSQGGQDTTIRVPAASDKPITVNLKYFQDIEGKFELPRGFRARSVKVNVISAGGGSAIEALYDWPQS